MVIASEMPKDSKIYGYRCRPTSLPPRNSGTGHAELVGQYRLGPACPLPKLSQPASQAHGLTRLQRSLLGLW